MSDASAVAAHDGAQTHHYTVHFPPHPARTSDPHYVDFDHYHRQHRASARCFVGQRIGFRDCKDAQGNPCPDPGDGHEQAGLELHHAHVEFSLQQGISLAALEVDFPGISDPTQVGAWVESDQNFRWLCVTPGTVVLMADGTERAIEDVGPGDLVIGHDGEAHPVTATGRRHYEGEILWLSPSCGLTPDHRVLTAAGWVTAGKVAGHLGVLGDEMSTVRGIQSKVLGSVVGAHAVDVVHALATVKRTPEHALHHESVLHHEAPTIPHTYVSGGRGLGGALADVPLRQRVESPEAALVGAVPAGSTTPVGSCPELRTAGLAGEDGSLRWLTVNHAVRTLHRGWVHDLSIAHSHSFVAGGIAVHNCVFHHRGAGGAHTAAHADWEAGQYVLGLISK